MKTEKNEHRCRRRRTPWYLWPIVAPLRLVWFCVCLSGRVVAAAAGLLIMIVGAIVTATLIGAPIGIPLCVLGFMLMLRSIF